MGEVARSAGEGWGEGSCLCGAIRYRFALPPIWVAHCHCTMCRRAQGAAFVTWVGTDGERFELMGDPGRLRTYRSSPAATRSFCGRCGTPLFFESTRWPGELHITLGSVDETTAARLQPQGHVHWATRVPWIGDIHDGLPRQDASGSS
ncbi:MAG: GFA family protein [Gammaproteobacteria bacterium]|nr:GFA family protein [Gammaproteobacteria bacterium]MDH5226929.1 GFA family protein [Gammaproteobacteria bacterium]